MCAAKILGFAAHYSINQFEKVYTHMFVSARKTIAAVAFAAITLTSSTSFAYADAASACAVSCQTVIVNTHLSMDTDTNQSSDGSESESLKTIKSINDSEEGNDKNSTLDNIALIGAALILFTTLGVKAFKRFRKSK